MANFGNCIDWVLRLEDRTLSGVVKDLGDGGGRTRFGIAEKWHPEAEDTFYESDVEFALEFAKDLYWRYYWMPIHGGVLLADELAATLLSFAVNDGVSAAVKLLQRVVGGLTVDGDLGAKTLLALTRLNPAEVASELRGEQEVFYLTAVKRNPLKAVYLKGWLRRAQAIYPDLPF